MQRKKWKINSFLVLRTGGELELHWGNPRENFQPFTCDRTATHRLVPDFVRWRRTGASVATNTVAERTVMSARHEAATGLTQYTLPRRPVNIWLHHGCRYWTHRRDGGGWWYAQSAWLSQWVTGTSERECEFDRWRRPCDFRAGTKAMIRCW